MKQSLPHKSILHVSYIGDSTTTKHDLQADMVLHN